MNLNKFDTLTEFIAKMKEAIINFDVALVGMGVTANLVCLEIKKLGKIGIDIGEAMTSLAGIKDQGRPFFDKYLYEKNK